MAAESSTRPGAGRTALRPVDLAREVGVSTQQIRNYADAGILPPAERTPSGYRRFDTRHRAALLAYRTLARGFGWDTARAVMRAVHEGDVPGGLALIDASHAALHGRRQELQATSEALHAVASAAQAPDAPASVMRIGDAARHLGLRASALRLWESAGLLTPPREPGTGYRRYGPDDVRDARMINILRQGRHPLPQIRALLDELRRTGSTRALRGAIEERRAALTRTAAAMLTGSAALHHYLSMDAPESGLFPDA
ncbi:MerR family transcriptional regulator [Nonomuraea fuscirosea]|uniref:MerR family transcriptional regulator n=1 Tax=Nonomuraea fuscirosea TaxID=1291556 RepID=UPI003418928D